MWRSFGVETSNIWEEVSGEDSRASPSWWTEQWWGLKMGIHSLITASSGRGSSPSSLSSTSGSHHPRMMILMDSRGLSTLYAADRVYRSFQKVTMVLLVAVLVFVTSSGLNSNEIRCPKECQCYNLQVDCSERGLHSVPKGIPRNVEKM